MNRGSKKKISKDPELGEEVATHRNHTERGPISNNVASTKKTASGRRHLIEELGSGKNCCQLTMSYYPMPIPIVS